MQIKIFDYPPDLDCFAINPQYRAIADKHGLTEWHAAVWIGRLFILDNDYGEHWLDNWELREQLETQAKERGLDSSELMIIDPRRFENGIDGPCHTPEFRKRFWTDVLKSLALDLELLFDEARTQNAETQKYLPDEFIADLETRIERIREQEKARN